MTIQKFIVPLFLLSSCSLVIDTGQVQCVDNSECTSLPSGTDTECVDSICVAVEPADLKFGCRDEPWPEVEAVSNEDVRFQILTLNGNVPVEGFTLNQCNSLFDRECEMPVSSATTDANGELFLPLPTGFRGHLFAESQQGYAEEIFHVFPPPDPSKPWTQELPMFVGNWSEVTAAAAIVGVSVLPNTGMLFFTARDCSGEVLQDVALSVTPDLPETQAAYLAASGLLDMSLEGTGVLGAGAVVNVPPGNITIKAVHKEFGTIFEQAVIITGTTITAATIVPAP